MAQEEIKRDEPVEEIEEKKTKSAVIDEVTEETAVDTVENVQVQEEKPKTLKEKWNNLWQKRKKVIIIGGVALVLSAGVVAILAKKFKKDKSEIDLSKLSLDEFMELREAVWQDDQNPNWRQNLEYIDSFYEKVKKPLVDKIAKLSDLELSQEIEKLRPIVYKGQDLIKKDKRPWAEISKDPIHKQYERNYRYFDALNSEQRARNAIANPSHHYREHGFNLYKPDND